MKSDLPLHGPLDSILIWSLGRRQATVGVKRMLGKEEDVAKMMTSTNLALKPRRNSGI